MHNLDSLNASLGSKAIFTIEDINSAPIHLMKIELKEKINNKKIILYKCISLVEDKILVGVQGQGETHVFGWEDDYINPEGKHLYEYGRKMAGFVNRYKPLPYSMSVKGSDYYDNHLNPSWTGEYFSWLIEFVERSLKGGQVPSSMKYREISRLINQKRVAIFGVGGTGAHVLEGLSKNKVSQIHIFDKDKLEQKNVWRFPGVINSSEIGKAKVDVLKNIYQSTSTSITAYNIDLTNEFDMPDIDFAFICLDNFNSKIKVVQKLSEKNIPYIITGIWMDFENKNMDCFNLTASVIFSKGREVEIPDDVKDAYVHNVQIYEANSLNANTALIAFKKHFGFYCGDLEEGYYKFDQSFMRLRKEKDV